MTSHKGTFPGTVKSSEFYTCSDLGQRAGHRGTDQRVGKIVCVIRHLLVSVVDAKGRRLQVAVILASCILGGL